jgi:NAD(P)-dependent dehydrogenase (short-subunit alcohol dehydrogenase family)
VNNVGVNVRKPIGQVTGADYSRMMATNVDSAFFLSQVTAQEATHTCGTGRQRCVGDALRNAVCIILKKNGKKNLRERWLECFKKTGRRVGLVRSGIFACAWHL